MILTRDQIGRLHANETVLHTEPIRPSHQQQLADGRTLQRCPWTPGRVYSVQVAVGKPAACRVEVLEAGVNGKAWTASLRIIRTRDDQPRLLAMRSERGYTSDPHRALTHEPEAVDADVQHRLSKQAQERHTTFQDQHGPPLHEQLQRELERAQTRGVDVTHLRLAIEQRVRALKRRNDQAA